MKKFPDFVPPTKVAFLERGPTLHLRQCVLGAADTDEEWLFEKDEIRIGSMDDNDVVVRDETVSRYHCKIVQEDTGYVLVDLRSTNGTFINKVRIREGFLKPGCTIGVGQSQLRFHAREEEVSIVPSRADRLGGLVGGNPRMREMYSILERIAPTNTTVVIEGETGTGKEVVAQTIHNLSPRAAKELVVFDCGAVPPNLIESELFGYEDAAFTGARKGGRPGKFELAEGGTLLLDEIGDMPLDLQPKLLRALEQREVRRVGGAKTAKVDVRIIAATNRNLEDEVRAGRFRQDLFYRLSVVRLRLPALRDRPDDVAALVQHFLDTAPYNQGADGRARVRGLTREAQLALAGYAWPGNVRELVNVIERAVSFADGEQIDVDDLPDNLRDAVRTPPAGRALTAEPRTASAPRPPDELLDGVTFKDAKERWVSSFERDYIVSLLKRHGGNISHAARDADIDRKYFRKLMKKYEIEAMGAVSPDEDEE